MDKHDANAFINEHQTEEVNIFEKCSTMEKQTTVIREVGEEEKLPTQWETKALFSSMPMYQVSNTSFLNNDMPNLDTTGSKFFSPFWARSCTSEHPFGKRWHPLLFGF